MPVAKENADYLMRQALSAGIKSEKELANFMGQMQVECGGFGSMNENLNYSAKGLLATFPNRNGMNTLAEATAVVKQGHEAIANQIYGGHWGVNNLGNTHDGDGWKYHGRGYVQLTGRSNYEAAGKATGLDLVNHPELAAEKENAAKIAIHYWKSRVVSKHDQLDVKDACFDINGGYNGLSERRAAAHDWENKLHHGYIKNNISDKPATNLSDLSPATQSLHADVSAKVQDLYTQHNQPIDQGTHNTAMQVTVALAEKGATGIERIAVKDGHIHAMQMRGAEAIIASVNTNDAANTPTEKSLSQLAAIDNTQSQMQANPTQNLNQSQGRSI